MDAKFLVVGTLAAAFTLYVWQMISNVALPWHQATMHMWEGPANDAVVQAMATHAPENGVYASPQGIVAAVSMTPDRADKSQNMAPMLTKQVFINLVVAFLLTVVLVRMRTMTPGATAVTFALGGLAAGIVIELSNWNWYGFDIAFTTVNAIDLAVAWFVTGFVLALVRQKLSSGLPELPGVVAPESIGIGASSAPSRR